MTRYFLVMLSCLLILGLTLPAKATNAEELNSALVQLKADYPQVKLFRDEGRITRIYGKPFGTGGTAEDAAEQFRVRYSQALGVEPDDLHPVSLLLDGRHTQPMMYNSQTEEYKFTLVYYSQYKDGIPVYRADLRLLALNKPGFPLVLAASALRDLGGFTVPSGVTVNSALAENAARSFSSGLANFTEPRLVIWAGIDDMKVEPAVAMEIIADNGMQATLEYEKWLLLIDAQTSEILYSESMILDIDVNGNVSGMATQGNGADICGPEVITPLPYSRVYISGGNTAFADENGDFVIPNSGSSPVTVISNIRGEWFRVYNQAGGDAQLSQSVTPPGPANFIHNASNTSEYNRAEVNAYYHANVVRDYTLTYNPSYPTIWNQFEWPVNVNLNDNCNAFYDGGSINFFTSGGECPNTAFSTIVHHEYGHHLVSVGGSGQGAYGEGMGDVMGILITDDPGLAYGFYGNCNQYMRTGDNTFQYPCSGEIHYCGQLISGCVWSTRNELALTYPFTYRDIIGNLAVNSILLHSGTSIDPSITIDYLTVDDDDGDIYNGTPHYNEICAGFGAHNMDCPELDLIAFNYPDGRPEVIDPLTSTTIRVEVYGINGTPEPGTGMLYYDDGSGWVNQPMDVISPNIYDAVLPGFECGLEISYYFTAEDQLGNVVSDPRDAPSMAFSVYSATAFVTAFDDDFNTNQGWTVQNSSGLTDGAWQRAIPAGGGDRGDPPTDYDGSGYCYVTDNADGNSDVDDGYTYLISPTFDLSDGEYIFQYALWYTNNNGNDPNNDLFKVWASSNNGADWVLVQIFGPATQAGWTENSFMVSDYVTPSSQVKVRFEASDLNDGSVVEAGVDAVSAVKIECEPIPGGTIYGTVTDMNTSNPVGGVLAFADDGGGNTGSDVTLGDGSYSIFLTPGTYTVSFTHDNYYDETAVGVDVFDGVNTLLDVEMEPLPSAEIPTLSEWGMIILALMLIATGSVAVIRRRKTSALKV